MALIYEISKDTGWLFFLRKPWFCLWSCTEFLQFFHFVQNSCQSHNGLICNRPSWRQWAGSGLMQNLWCGLRLCELWSTEKNHLFWRAFLSYASHMHVLSEFSRGEWAYAGACYVSSLVFVVLATIQIKEHWVRSVLTTRLIWSVLLSSLRPFLFIIKLNHSPALLSLIHLGQSFNHWHTAHCFLPTKPDLILQSAQLID